MGQGGGDECHIWTGRRDVIEQREHNKLSRPMADYVGPEAQAFVSLERRQVEFPPRQTSRAA